MRAAKPSPGQAFHLVNPHGLHLRQLVELVRSFGYALDQKPYTQWRADLIQATEHSTDNALYSLVTFFPQIDDASAQERTGEYQIFDCGNALAGLRNSPIACPPVDETLLQVYWSYMLRNAFLPAPKLIRSSL